MKENVLIKRLKKDQFFKNDARTPLPIWAKKRFSGLSYFSYNENWVLNCRLQLKQNEELIEITNNFGGKETYFVYADIYFTINNTPYSLQLFVLKQNNLIYWLPFKDLTNGTETYGAGRFLEVEPKLILSETFTLDFNEAYNPYCAYNEKYSCPIIPQSNILNIKIEAGEKKPPKWI